MSDQESRHKVLPSGRLSLEKQIAILKSYVAFYDDEKRPATNKEIAAISTTDDTNISSFKPFWVSIGFLRDEGGKSAPTDIVIDFCKKLTWAKQGEEDSAWSVFRQAVSNEWFVKHLTRSFKVKTKQTKDEVLVSLGQASEIAKRDKKAEQGLVRLLELMVKGGFLKEGENLTYEFRELQTQTVVKLEEERDLVTFTHLGEKYVLDRDKLVDFVLQNGKKLSTVEHSI